MNEIHHTEANYKESEILAIFQNRNQTLCSTEDVRSSIKPVLALAIIAAFCAYQLKSDYSTGCVVGMSTALLLIGLRMVYILIECGGTRESRANARAMDGKLVSIESSHEKITLTSGQDKKLHDWLNISYAAINPDFILLDFKGPQQIFPRTSMSTTDFQLFYETVQQKIHDATVTPS